MTTFDNLRELSEKIVRERAYDPQQLAAILSTLFVMTDDELPNHFRYKATLKNHPLFSACDLRAPKTDRAKTAILICDVIKGGVTKDVNTAYGESVEFKPASPSSPRALHYLAIKFDNAELSFGIAQNSDKIKTMVINFDL